MDEATRRKIEEEKSIKNFLENNKDSSYAHDFLRISPENIEEFEKKFPIITFEPSFEGYTSVIIIP